MRDCGRFRRFIKVDLVKIVSVFWSCQRGVVSCQSGVVRGEVSVVRGELSVVRRGVKVPKVLKVSL